MKLLKAIAMCAGISCMIYLLGVFANASFDIKNWNVDGRGFLTCFMGFGWLFAVLFAYLEGEKF